MAKGAIMGVIEDTVVRPKRNKYVRDVPSKEIDVYDVLKAFNVTQPAVAHAVKKLLAPGKRGVKTWLEDIGEARDSLARAIEMENT